MSVAIEPVGSNPVRLWGLTSDERLRRIAAGRKLSAGGDGDRLLVNLAFVFDPVWLDLAASHPNHVVTRHEIPVLARVSGPAETAVREAMEDGRPLASTPGLTVVEQESFGALVNKTLRKREQPFMEALTAESRKRLERTSYYASYKGVTDLLTKYLWPEWALVLTRLAARIGLSPNMVTLIGAILCVAAGIAFWHGWYWSGLFVGLGFMVLDTVDGKLARCTITSSRWGEAFDHGIDLIHPPFWWWAWGVGLHAYGRPLEDAVFAAIMIAIVAGYVVQRLIEGAFIARFGMHIHVWEQVDSRFRLITARRNPNMVILVAALILGRPDLGLAALAAWTLLSCLFHLVRLLQAWLARARGRRIESWLS